MISHSSKDLDKTVVTHFMSDKQSTHDELACSSVGMALLVLANNYFPQENMTMALIKKNYYSATGQATKKTIDKKYNEVIQEIRKNYKAANHELAINYLDEQAGEIKQEDQETVKLFLPVGSTAQQGYRDLLYVFPLRLVIVLVWTALRHHQKYEHNYESDKENKARGDYSERTDSFFECIESFYLDSLCRTGIRNELMFILNKSYLGIDLIEDALGVVIYELRQQINKLFWEKYATATPLLKKKLSSSLFVWIGEQDSSALLSLLGSAATNQKNLYDLFISHGINPHTMQLDSKIKNALPLLTFTDNTKNSYLSIISSILTSSSDDDYWPERNAAVKAMQKWIYGHCNLNDNSPIDDLQQFHMLYQAQKELSQYYNLLLAQGQMHESFKNLSAICDRYFQQYVVAVENNKALPVIAPETITTTKYLDKIIAECKNSAMVPVIENFFSRLFIADQIGSYEEAVAVYGMLLDEHIKSKIILSAEKITATLESISQAGLLGKHYEITPYEINRILLHGIYFTPATWSSDFKKLFELIYGFIKNNFNESAENHLVTKLSLDSYKPLLVQLNYLHQCAQGENVDRPQRMIILPDQVVNAKEWIGISRICTALGKCTEIYQPRAAKITNLIMKYIADNDYASNTAFKALKSIPRIYRFSFITNQLITESSPWFSNIQQWFALKYLLDDDVLVNIYLSHESKINLLIRNFLQENNDSEDSIKEVVETAPSQHLSTMIISILAGFTTSNSIKIWFKFAKLLDNKNLAEIYAPYADEVDESLLSDIKARAYCNSSISNSIKLLPYENRLNFLKVKIGADVLKYTMRSELFLCLNALLEIDRNNFLRLINIRFGNVVLEINELTDFLLKLPKSDRLPFLTSELCISYLQVCLAENSGKVDKKLQDLLSGSGLDYEDFIFGEPFVKIVKNITAKTHNLGKVLTNLLPWGYCYAFLFDALDIEYIKKTITDGNNLISVLHIVPENDRLMFLRDVLGMKFFMRLIKDSKSLWNSLAPLSENDKATILHLFMKKLDANSAAKLVPNFHELSWFITMMPINDKTSILYILDSSFLIGLIPNHDTLSKLMSLFSPTDNAKLVNILMKSLDNKFIAKFVKNFEELLYLTSRLPEEKRIPFLELPLIKTFLTSCPDYNLFSIMYILRNDHRFEYITTQLSLSFVTSKLETAENIAQLVGSIPVEKQSDYLLKTLGIDFVQAKLKKLSDLVTITKSVAANHRFYFLNRIEFLNYISNLLINNKASMYDEQNPAKDFVELLKLLTVDEGTSLINRIGIDLPLATKILFKLDDKTKNILIQRLPPAIATAFVGDFSKHYYSLRNQGFFLFTIFKTNWPKEIKIPTPDPRKDVDEILKHAQTDNSRSREAWFLMNGVNKPTPTSNTSFSNRSDWDTFEAWELRSHPF